MRESEDVDALIREALEAEHSEALARLAEPGLPETVADLFRGKMRWYGGLFFAMILVCAVGAVFCAIRFFSVNEVPAMLRWGGGFFFAFLALQGGKTWYWMQHERVALTRELKRLELLVAQIAVRLSAQ